LPLARSVDTAVAFQSRTTCGLAAAEVSFARPAVAA
jgi:hypothetical protein